MQKNNWKLFAKISFCQPFQQFRDHYPWPETFCAFIGSNFIFYTQLMTSFVTQAFSTPVLSLHVHCIRLAIQCSVHCRTAANFIFSEGFMRIRMGLPQELLSGLSNSEQFRTETTIHEQIYKVCFNNHYWKLSQDLSFLHLKEPKCEPTAYPR